MDTRDRRKSFIFSTFFTPVCRSVISLAGFLGIILAFTLLITPAALSQEGEWKLVESGTTEQLNDVWIAPDATIVIAVGNNGTILQLDVPTLTWSPMESGTENDLLSVHGNSANDVAASGTGVVLRFGGGEWTTILDDPGGQSFTELFNTDTSIFVASPPPPPVDGLQGGFPFLSRFDKEMSAFGFGRAIESTVVGFGESEDPDSVNFVAQNGDVANMTDFLELTPIHDQEPPVELLEAEISFDGRSGIGIRKRLDGNGTEIMRLSLSSADTEPSSWDPMVPNTPEGCTFLDIDYGNAKSVQAFLAGFDDKTFKGKIFSVTKDSIKEEDIPEVGGLTSVDSLRIDVFTLEIVPEEFGKTLVRSSGTLLEATPTPSGSGCRLTCIPGRVTLKPSADNLASILVKAEADDGTELNVPVSVSLFDTSVVSVVRTGDVLTPTTFAIRCIEVNKEVEIFFGSDPDVIDCEPCKVVVTCVEPFFIFNCRQNLLKGYAGLERLELEQGDNESCTIKLSRLEPGAPVKVATKLNAGISSSIKVEPEIGVTDANGEIEFTISAIKSGIDWIVWAVPDENGKISFGKKAIDAGLVWGMFVEVK